ncbi:uncharacterized protein VTP21DRAFT_4370 [Calcarisporiella thermophila]|uniref:uncharacterized protein n=1 Tax=Calcarisporiella thermophila TaxID=911321 RepID=UPI003743B277
MLEPLPTDNPRYRPYPPTVATTRVQTAKYSTSLDLRGYIPVYEYTINDQLIMWDRETGEIHFTGIWKALGNSKAEIIKMIDTNPELPVKRIRGGFLRIQGTWIPYDYAQLLARRTCYRIREELVPIFGPSFPDTCLRPDQPGYGCLVLNPHAGGTKRSRRREGKEMVRTDSGTSIREPISEEVVMEEEVLGWGRARPVAFRPEAASPRTPTLRTSSSPLAKSESPLSHRSPRGMDFLLNGDDDMEESSERWRPQRSYSSSVCDIRPSSFPVAQSRSLDGTSGGGWHALPPSRPSSTPTRTHLPPPITFIPKNHLMNVANPTASSEPNPYHPPSHDTIEAMMASLLLQRLSQDDGRRPFRPWHETRLPRTVVMEDQEFAVVWKE